MYASFCKLGYLGKTYVIVSRRNMRTPNSPVPTRVRWYYACDRHSGGNNTEESIGCSLRMERSFNFWLAFERGIARQNPSWYPWFMRSFGVWLLITSAGNGATTPSSRQRWFTKRFCAWQVEVSLNGRIVPTSLPFLPG